MYIQNTECMSLTPWATSRSSILWWNLQLHHHHESLLLDTVLREIRPFWHAVCRILCSEMQLVCWMFTDVSGECTNLCIQGWRAGCASKQKVQEHNSLHAGRTNSLIMKKMTVELSWCCDWRSVGLSILVSGTPLGPMTRFFSFRSFAGQLHCSSSWNTLSDERKGL
jgi:hypothetical protein